MNKHEINVDQPLNMDLLKSKYTLIFDENNHTIIIKNVEFQRQFLTKNKYVVFAEWASKQQECRLHVYLDIGEVEMDTRTDFYKSNIKLIIKHILDLENIYDLKQLSDALIEVHYISRNFEYNTILNMGKISTFN